MRLEGKVAVIVGAGQSPGEGIGNGRATTLRFAQEGARILAVDRLIASAEETAAMATQVGECVPCAADVTKEATLAAAMEAARARWGRIDILHNNVGSALGVATSRWTNCTRHSANSPPIALARWPGLASAALVFFVADTSIRPLCRCSRGVTRHGTRVVDIELDDLAGEGCCGHQRHALRRLKAVPSTLRINRDHPGAESEGLGWSVVADDFQSRSAVEDVDQLVAREMGFPMTFPGKLRNAKAAIAVRRQTCAAALAIRYRRLRGPSTEHRQLRELGAELDDAGCSAWHHSLWFRRPRVVDIMLDVVAGKRRAPGCPALCGAKAVPGALWNDSDHSGAELERLGRSVVAHDVEDLRAIENVYQLVLGMVFPVVCPRVLTGEEDTVAIGAQLRRAAMTLCSRCLRCQSVEHSQFCEFGVEIDNAGYSTFHFPLHLLTATENPGHAPDSCTNCQKAPTPSGHRALRCEARAPIPLA